MLPMLFVEQTEKNAIVDKSDDAGACVVTLTVMEARDLPSMDFIRCVCELVCSARYANA
jgi:hypothetical protein